MSQMELVPRLDAAILRAMDVILLDDNRNLRVLPASVYAEFPHVALRVWMQARARYLLPTVELVDYVQGLIGGRSALEIGAGMGDFGRHLGIRMTDSGLQEIPEIRRMYQAAECAITEPPPDVERLDAAAAITKYTPEVCVAAWVTQKSLPHEQWPLTTKSSPFGVDEEDLLTRVRTYIFVGNLGSHNDKRIFKSAHQFHPQPGWIVSRGKHQKDDFVAVWQRA
jgi:hypothetical protein